MNRDAVIQTLQTHQSELRGLGVRRAALFGSCARGEETTASDIDLMVEIDPHAAIGVFEYAGIVEYLQGLFPARVDVANHAKLKSLVRPAAERDAIYAF